MPLIAVGGIANGRRRVGADPRRREPGPALHRDGLRGPGHRAADRARACASGSSATASRSIAEAVGTRVARGRCANASLARFAGLLARRRSRRVANRRLRAAAPTRQAWSPPPIRAPPRPGVEILRAGRQRGRRRVRDDARADRGRAAKLGHRRRRLPRLSRRSGAAPVDLSTAARPRRTRRPATYFLEPTASRATMARRCPAG